MGIVVAVALAIGTFGEAKPTPEQRAYNLETTIRCPSCASQSVANSETPAAQGVKVLIQQRIAAGDTDDQIRDYVVSRYTKSILLDPASKGFGALVWGVPVAFGVIAVAALIFRFSDWRPGSLPVTDADRTLVADALAGEGADEPGGDAADEDAR